VKAGLNTGIHPLENEAYLGKNGFLLMGESGLGKSTAFKSILLASRYRCLSPDQVPPTPGSLYFYQVTAQNRAQAAKILDNGLRFGIPVIIDEFNLIQSTQFDAYLDGWFPENSPFFGQPPAAGCVLLLTGNPADQYRGRYPITAKTYDQTVNLSWTDPYTDADFKVILTRAFGRKPVPNRILASIKVYLAQAKSGIMPNSRTVFEGIQRYCKQGSSPI